MKELDLDKIKISSPYLVTWDSATNLYKFVSDYDVSFSVGFEKMTYLKVENLTNLL